MEIHSGTVNTVTEYNSEDWRVKGSGNNGVNMYRRIFNRFPLFALEIFAFERFWDYIAMHTNVDGIIIISIFSENAVIFYVEI